MMVYGVLVVGYFVVLVGRGTLYALFMSNTATAIHKRALNGSHTHTRLARARRKVDARPPARQA
jgi:hypothetical protein